MQHLKNIKSALIEEVEEQLSHLECIDAAELGEAVDMIKDMEEAMYYHVITEAMLNHDTESEVEPTRMYYGTTKMIMHDDEDEELEGHSAQKRKSYLEAKRHNKDKMYQLKELESYLQELSNDILELIGEASTEERQLLQKKISTLATKISE